MGVCTHECKSLKSPEVSNPLDLEFQAVVSPHPNVGTKMGTWVLWKNSMYS